VVKLLLDKGANIEAKDNSGKTALALATSMSHSDVVKLLREKGAK
jgi:ankyrin repeat protein